MMVLCIAKHDVSKCQLCGSCQQLVSCPGSAEEICLGCGACVLMCPHQALEMVEDPRLAEVNLEVDGKAVRVPERITVKEALLSLGYPMATMLADPGIIAPCDVGACWSCAVLVEGVARPACKVGVKEGMHIDTRLPIDYVPKRIVTGFAGHNAGGVGTPWQIKSRRPYVEAVCFASGCNFRCPQCQNWYIAHRGDGKALTPRQAADKLTLTRQSVKVERMVISGGEPTLNRPWLLQFLRELKALNPDKEARFHVDTNGALLTHAYIDELVEAGMTDVGIDLKAQDLHTFMRITGLSDPELAHKHIDTAWGAVQYAVGEYPHKLFLGVGLPYNKQLISAEEIMRVGRKLCEIDPSIQVTVLNYRPAFRSQIPMPSDSEVEEIGRILREIGLKTVICQTTNGFVGP